MTDTGEGIQDRNEEKRAPGEEAEGGRRTESIFVARYGKRIRSWARLQGKQEVHHDRRSCLLETQV